MYKVISTLSRLGASAARTILRARAPDNANPTKAATSSTASDIDAHTHVKALIALRKKPIIPLNGVTITTAKQRETDRHTTQPCLERDVVHAQSTTLASFGEYKRAQFADELENKLKELARARRLDWMLEQHLKTRRYLESLKEQEQRQQFGIFESELHTLEQLALWRREVLLEYIFKDQNCVTDEEKRHVEHLADLGLANFIPRFSGYSVWG